MEDTCFHKEIVVYTFLIVSLIFFPIWFHSS